MKRTKRTWTAPNGRVYPVVEPDVGLMVKIGAQDVASGVQTDVHNCAIANCLKRTLDSPAAMIGVTMAYVVMKHRSEWVALRMQVPVGTRRAIDDFDRTGRMPDEGFRLAPVRPSNSAEGRRARNKRDRKRWQLWDRTNPSTAENRNMQPRTVSLRTGSGKVHTGDEVDISEALA